VKPVALVLVPVVFGRRGSKERALLVAGGVLSLAVALPYVEGGAKLFAGFRAYAEHWDANDLFFSSLVGAGLSPRASRVVLAFAITLVALVVPWRVRDGMAASGIVLLGFLALSPTVHSWYASWLVPLLVFLPRGISMAGVALVSLLPATYVTAVLQRETGIWAEPEWLKVVLWGPVAAALLVGWVRARDRAPREPTRLEKPRDATG
jgi:hypothetical protein